MMAIETAEPPDTALRRVISEQAEKVVWLVGAGFSRPLGGPLFSELLGSRIEKWVAAWIQWRSCAAADIWDAFREFERGVRAGLWTNAEECLGLLDEARTSTLTETLVKQHLGSNKDVARVCARLSQFVAIAASFFVERVAESGDLPEAWNPYSAWASGLTEDDTLISFNYDRVIEELSKRRASSGPISAIHLHGIVPEWPQLKSAVLAGERVAISMPGPSKLFDSQNSLAPFWEQARRALHRADRVVVMGYSFPVSDPVARSFILANVSEPRVSIVLGPGEEGETVAAMFKRQNLPDVRDTRLYVQQYLAEGRVRREGLRFNHQMFHLSPE